MADLITELSRIKTGSSVGLLVLLLAWGSWMPFFAYFAGAASERIRHGLKNLALGVLNAVMTGLGFVGIWWSTAEWAERQHFGMLRWVELPVWARLVGAVAAVARGRSGWQLLRLRDTFHLMSLLTKISSSKAPNAVLLIRLMVGVVFLSEGIQKFLFPAEVGAGRFAKIGLPSPEFLGPFVGGFEITCGTLVLLGLFTRLAVMPLLTIMAVALYSTKLPILLNSGFWKMAHEARTDFSMLLGLLFLLIVGAGTWSLDARLGKSGASEERDTTE